jgi:hypothetical protein
MISMRDESVPGIPLPAEAGPRKWDWRLALSAILWVVPAVVAFARVVPEFDRVYRQIKIPQPMATEAVLAISRMVSEYLWLVGIGLVFFVLDVGYWTGRKAATARVLIPLMTLIFLGLMVVALFLPLIGMDHGIGQRRH